MLNGPTLWDEIIGKLIRSDVDFPQLASKAVVAGGAVRDYMLDLKPADIDVFIIPASLDMSVAFAGYGFSLNNQDLSRAGHPEYEEWSAGRLTGLMDGYYVDSDGDKHKVQLIYSQDLCVSEGELAMNFDSEINRVVYCGGGEDVQTIGNALHDYKQKTYTVTSASRSHDRTKARYQRFNYKNPGLLAYINPFEAEDKGLSDLFA